MPYNEPNDQAEVRGVPHVRFGSRPCKNAFLVGGRGRIGERISCSDRFYQSADAQNAHCPFDVVGQNV